MRRALLPVLLAAAAAAAAASRGAAQGTLSTQGYGYPAGPLSTRAQTMGGGIAETDPVSALNPAALTSWGPSGFYGQFTPEFRTVDANGQSEESHVIRFPLFAGALTAGPDWTFGLSFSNVLDRTWGTQVTGWYQLSGGDSVQYTQTFKSGGALTNIRLAAGYRLSNRIRVGVAGHYFTGQTTLTVFESFVDSAFATFQQITTVNLSGAGLSGGLEWSPVEQFAIGLSGQVGGVMHARRNDTLVANGHVPARAGASLIFAGIRGVLIAADAEWNQWSEMNGLAQSTIRAVDAWDYGAGAEIRVASLGGADVPVRVGLRRRTLPFQADSSTVTESLFSAGIGLPVARGRGRVDFGLIHATRSAAVPGVSEKGLQFSVGVLVRP